MRSVISVVFTFVLIQQLHAQRDCGTEKNYREFPSIVARPGDINGHDRDTIPNEIITIPVVIHLLYKSGEQNISDDQVLSQIEVLNRDFRRLNTDAVNTPVAFRNAAADCRIMFCLAQVSPGGMSTKGIIRKYTNKDFFLGDDGMKFSAQGGDDAWDSKRYLNIWVCSLFGRSLGYATMPGGETDKDGVVIKYDVFGSRGVLRAPYNKGRTATHEVGHWLGLKHIWGDADCGTDDVDDTPSQKSYNYDCPSFPHVSGCSPNGNGDMFMNFMDFTSDACMNMFTNGQKMKVRSGFASGGIHNSFLNSFACDSSLATGGPLPIETIHVSMPAPGIQIFPNPVLNEVNLISVNNYLMAGKTCTLYSMEGKRLVQIQLTSEKEKIIVVALNAGVYILKIGEGADMRILKMIKL
ncbi:MAG: M43 family zinc metalloprotease [Ferruginibacter sp.]